MAELRKLLRLHLSERGVGGDNDQRRVLTREAGGSVRLSSGRAPSANSMLSGAMRAPAIILPVAGSRTSPTAFTAASAATFAPAFAPSSSTVNEPMPDFMACFIPRVFPTVAPVPAPTAPSTTGFIGGRGGGGFAHFAGGPDAGLAQCRGRRESRRTTIGRWTPRRVLKPTPLCSRNRRTPLAASSPNALPPAKTTAWMRSVTCMGLSTSHSSGAGGGAANIAAGDGSRFAQHDGAARQSVIIGCMADQDPGMSVRPFHAPLN